VLYGTRNVRLRTRRETRIGLATIGVAAVVGLAGLATGSPERWVRNAARSLDHAARNVDQRRARSIGHGQAEPIGGQDFANYGTAYTLRGRTAGLEGLHATGTVIIRGRWNRGRWTTLGRTRTDALGRYSITAKLRRRGRLELRLVTPDGFIGEKTLTVA
jgi:hypothetical protein